MIAKLIESLFFMLVRNLPVGPRRVFGGAERSVGNQVDVLRLTEGGELRLRKMRRDLDLPKKDCCLKRVFVVVFNE